MKKSVDIMTVNCPKKACKGALINVSSILAEGLGRMDLQCTDCHDKYSVDATVPVRFNGRKFEVQRTKSQSV